MQEFHSLKCLERKARLFTPRLPPILRVGSARVGARQILIAYWTGHENPDMSARYGKQLVEDVKYRQQWAEKVGLGFELPPVSEPESTVNCDRSYRIHG
jgi:hypothetical protein